MRVATVGAFTLGFACGVATLGILAWSHGWKSEVKVVAANAPPPAPVASPAPPVNRLVSGEADRTVGSSQPAHLKMPLDDIDPNQLAETFNDTRDGGRPHEALDIAAPRGTPVKAVAEGNVVKLFFSKQGGITVYQFDDSGTYCYYYAHLDRYAPSLKEGMLLRAGDVLGYVGTTGNAPANVPHLHFAVFRLGPEKQWWKGTAIDPLPLLK